MPKHVDKQKIETMLKDGKTYTEIHAETGASPVTIAKISKSSGVQKPGTPRKQTVTGGISPQKTAILTLSPTTPLLPIRQRIPTKIATALQDILGLKRFKNFQSGGSNQNKAESLDIIEKWLESNDPLY